MSRELCLLRHGKAVVAGIEGDFDRPLTKRGCRDAHRMGIWMRQQYGLPDWIISSPAVRALATANQAACGLGVDPATIRFDQRLYFQGITAIKAVLAELPAEAKRTLLIGHNPDLEDLLIELAGASNLPLRDKLMPTAALVRLRLPDDWRGLSINCADLLSISLAKELRDG